MRTFLKFIGIFAGIPLIVAGFLWIMMVYLPKDRIAESNRMRDLLAQPYHVLPHEDKLFTFSTSTMNGTRDQPEPVVRFMFLYRGNNKIVELPMDKVVVNTAAKSNRATVQFLMRSGVESNILGSEGEFMEDPNRYLRYSVLYIVITCREEDWQPPR
jgi:hypothetical protein